MEDAALLTQDDVTKLRHFHQLHFAGQDVPNVQSNTNPSEAHTEEVTQQDLGTYEDGVRRTLTDEQVAMFRHSEIQRLLAERRRQNDLEEERKQKEQRTRRKVRREQNSKVGSAVFDNDVTMHSRAEIGELSYDDGTTSTSMPQPKKFQWPTLGA